MDKDMHSDDGKQPGLDRIEELLKQRTMQESELPWLEVRVMSQVEVREQARDWLDRNGSLFGPLSQLPASQPVTAFARYFSELTQMLGQGRAWVTIGAAIAGGAAGYFLGSTFVESGITFQQGLTVSSTSVSVSLSVIGAALAGLASQWNNLREYYS